MRDDSPIQVNSNNVVNSQLSTPVFRDVITNQVDSSDDGQQPKHSRRLQSGSSIQDSECAHLTVSDPNSIQTDL